MDIILTIGGLYMTLNTSIGSRISTLRKKNNLTQEQLAERLDISIKHCSSVERGLSCLSLEKLVEVSELFDVSLDFLIKGTSSNYVCLELSPSIISVLTSKNESEKELLQDYLHLYTKIRTMPKET